jgi:hypothetical protein
MMVLVEPADMGLLLLCFKNMSGLKINFNKSEAIVTAAMEMEARRISNILNYKLVKLPMKYLGLHVSDRPLRVLDLDFLSEKVGHRVDP